MKLDRKLVGYAERFLSMHPELESPVEQAAAFASQLRDGCHQDLVRLMERFIRDVPPNVTGKEALFIAGCAINEGADIRLLGMPDCICKRADCVYCARGLATPTSTAEGGCATPVSTNHEGEHQG